jgi:hypothetical protein
MANPLEIQNKSKLIEGRMQELFLELRAQYNNGEIKTRTEYLYQIFNRLRVFYDTIGKPTMQVREADRVPSSREYNQMILEVHKDLGILYEEAEQITQALSESFLQIEIDRRSLDQQLRHLEDKMKEVAKKMSQEAFTKVFRDSFIDQENYDQDMPRDVLAHVWTREGVLTLQPRISEDYIQEATVRIVDGNGLPGNTKQVRSIAGELKFIGEENLHLNLAEILDTNADTWFEYESFELTPRTLLEAGYLGFDYKEGMRWIVEQGTALTFTIEIELPVAKPVNWFSINPFIPNDKGASASRIKKIELHDGKGSVYQPLEGDGTFSEEKIFLFGRQDCKRIVITFEQEHAYETQVGHLFYKEMQQQKTNYLGKTKYFAGKRVYETMPSVENLNVRYDEELKDIVYPTVSYGQEIEGLPQLKSNLFMLPKIDNKVSTLQVGHESLPAYRYVIGLRDAGLSNYQFEKSSEYVSKAFTTASDILSVSLVTNESIPKEFGEGEWVRYWVSPDNGQNWYRIHAKGASKEGAKLLYLFNTETPNEGRLDQFGYVDQVDAVKSLRLKIEMERPDSIGNATYYTPIIKDYELHITTRGGESL